MALKQRECGFIERCHRATPRRILPCAIVQSGRVQIFKIGNELVEGRVGQVDVRPRGAPEELCAKVNRGHASRSAYAGHLRQRGDEAGPILTLCGEHGASGVSNAVIPPAALAGRLAAA